MNANNYKNDSLINLNKTLKSQFNLIRSADNKNYPFFFYYKNRKFYIRISLK